SGAKLDLDVDARAGADTVDLVFADFGKHAKADIDVDLGRGDDTAKIAITGTVDKTANVSIEVDGGAGQDTATFELGTAESQVHVKVKHVETVVGLTQKPKQHHEDEGDDDQGEDHDDD